MEDILWDLGPFKPPATLSLATGERSRQFSVQTMIKVVVALACVFALLVILGRAVGAAREAARRAQCTCNLCQIKLALHNYHETYGSFPPAHVADVNGKPVHSWRILILPFMGQETLYNAYDFSEPWNGPNNIKLLGQMPSSFACPSRDDGRNGSTTRTSFVLISGAGTIFPGTKSTKLSDITDGTSNTLMIVEISNADVPWTSPRDLDVSSMSFRVNDPNRAGISSLHPGGANVTFADASTRFLHESIAPADLKTLITIDAGEEVGPP